MKKLRALHTVLGKQTIQVSAVAVLATVLGGAFWVVTATTALAGPPLCDVCHKRTVTQSYPCNSLEYRRHLDHGDPMGACGATPIASDRRVSPPLRPVATRN